jgi:hypothetical protein
LNLRKRREGKGFIASEVLSPNATAVVEKLDILQVKTF